MTDTKKNKGQKIAFAFSCVLPVAILSLAVLLLLGDTVPNLTFILAYLLLPIGVILLQRFTLFSRMKIWLKVIVSIFLLCILVVAFFFITTVGKMEMVSRYQDEKAKEIYANIDAEYLGIPSLEDVGNPNEIEYIEYFSQQMIFFDVDVNALKCTYDESEYVQEEKLLNEKYIFQNKPVSANEYTIEPTVEIDGYTFRLLSFDGEYGDKFYYPKYMMFIATNDATNEILYLHFADADLDYIVDLSEFLFDDCGWRYIRKSSAIANKTAHRKLHL